MLQALDGFMIAVTSDGTILYVSDNILQHLGFNQVDLIMRCMYGIVHPDDHQELKVILEQTLSVHFATDSIQHRLCCSAPSKPDGAAPCRKLSFLCRMKCFNGTTTGYLKMQCVGHLRSFPHVTKSQRTSNHVLFAFCRPFLSVSTDPANTTRNSGFWTKHDLDLKFKQMEAKLTSALGYQPSELEMRSLYDVIHPEDLLVVRNCHRALIQTDEIQTMYFRVQHKDGSWMWLHSRSKVALKNGRKYSIIFTHCPVREVDSTYIQQEALLRQRYAIPELTYGAHGAIGNVVHSAAGADRARDARPGGVVDELGASFLHEGHGHCPSSWHTGADRHSPVFPQHHLPHQPHSGNKRCNGNGNNNHNNNHNNHNNNSSYHVNGNSYQNTWLASAGGYQSNYPPVVLWDGSRDKHGGYDEGCWPVIGRFAPNELCVDAVTAQYWLAGHDVTNISAQHPAPALLVRGHVAAYDSEPGSPNRVAAGCAYTPASGDCAYGPLASDNREGERPSCQYGQPHPTMTSDGPRSEEARVKQENVYGGGHVTWARPGYVHEYPHLRAASDICYPSDDVIANFRSRASFFL